MLEEFKKFVLRGNVVDLAVGVVIGVATTSVSLCPDSQYAIGTGSAVESGESELQSASCGA
jgi:hypothetical protein